MADKFEFKTKQHLHKPDALIKKKTSLIQYKQLIFQLSEAVNELSKENEMLKTQIQNLKHKNEKQNETLMIMQKQMCSLKQKQQNDKQVLYNKQQMINNIKSKCHELQAQIKLKEQSYHKLQINATGEAQKKNYIEQLNQAHLLKIKMLETKLQELQSMNEGLALQFEKRNEQNQLQLKSLRQFNQDLRRKFKNMQIENISSFYNNSELNERRNAQQCDFKQKRCFSTEKKTKRNIGFLSCNTEVLNKKSKGEQMQYHINKNIKPFKAHANNPELYSELESLKSEIAHQYTLINLKSESYNKQRVSRTLEALKQKMGHVYMEVQESDSQSCLQY